MGKSRVTFTVATLEAHNVCENGRNRWVELFGSDPVTFKAAVRALKELKTSGRMDQEEYERFFKFTLLMREAEGPKPNLNQGETSVKCV